MSQRRGNNHQYGYSSGGYNANRPNDEMNVHFKEYKRKNRVRKKAFRTTALVMVPILIITAAVLMNTSCQHSDRQSQVDTTETAASVVTASDVFASDAENPSSDIPEESASEQEGVLTYDNPHEYRVNNKRFSADTYTMFDKTITSEFVALYDVTADEVIFSKNYNKKCYPASTTKLLTAITASNIITDPDTVITVGDEIQLIGWDSSRACLEEGMQLTFEMLIDALLLPSGNDAAYTIAVNCGRIYKDDPSLSNEEAVEVFMGLVNDAAKQIGADHTHYVTPDGWHDDDHYTSAQDLVVIGDYAKTIPLISKSCAKAYVEYELIKGGSIAWSNSNKLLLSDSGVYSEYCDGLKTGFTDEAGTSVVASATIDHHTFIAVVMNGENLYSKYEDCNLLFKKAFELYDLDYTFG